MEPVLAAGHDGQLRPDAFCERGYGLLGGQIVPLPVQNTGRDAPLDRMLAHIAEIAPRQRLAKVRSDLPPFLKPLFGDVRPRHHIAYQLLHVNDR